jgi:hypothetical protein
MAGECNMLNGRRELIVHVKNFYVTNFSKDLTDFQLKQKNTQLLNQYRHGIIRPECTRKDCIKKKEGRRCTWRSLQGRRRQEQQEEQPD